MTSIARRAIQVSLASQISALLAASADRLQTRWGAWASRREVSSLTDAQLDDCGIDSSLIRPCRPVIEIEQGLMDRLLTAR